MSAKYFQMQSGAYVPGSKHDSSNDTRSETSILER